jgi:hypothetical protein
LNTPTSVGQVRFESPVPQRCSQMSLGSMMQPCSTTLAWYRSAKGRIQRNNSKRLPSESNFCFSDCDEYLTITEFDFLTVALGAFTIGFVNWPSGMPVIFDQRICSDTISSREHCTRARNRPSSIAKERKYLINALTSNSLSLTISTCLWFRFVPSQTQITKPVGGFMRLPMD